MKKLTSILLVLILSGNLFSQVSTMISGTNTWDVLIDGDDLYYVNSSSLVHKADVSNPCFVVPPSTFIFDPEAEPGSPVHHVFALAKKGDDLYFSATQEAGYAETMKIFKKDLSYLPTPVVEVSDDYAPVSMNLDIHETFVGTYLYYGSGLPAYLHRYDVSGALPVSSTLYLSKLAYSLDIEGSTMYFGTLVDGGTPPTLYSKNLLTPTPEVALFSDVDGVARDLEYFDGMLYFIDNEGLKRIDPSLPAPTSQLLLTQADYGELNRLQIKSYATGDIFMFVSERDGDRILKVELSHAMFQYSKTEFCKNEPDPIPVHSGISGNFTSSPSGLSINYLTGEIDLSATTAGTYTVTHTTTGACPKVSDVTITINEVDDASMSFSAASYCMDETDPTPVISGLAGGTFTSVPAGLSIEPSTGEIDLSASTPDTYTVTYTTAGLCPNSSDVSVTINAPDDASFSFPTTTYCIDESDPTPTITGLTGGTFSSSPAGISMDPTTGEIDLSVSTPGTYTVTYNTPIAATCPNSSDVTLTINTPDDASFSFPTTTYCQDESDPTPSITGLAGGTFTSAPAGLSIDAATGEIDLSESSGGIYTITYTSDGPCPSSSDNSITINAIDVSVTQFDFMLEANLPSATYQWLDCDDDFEPIPGETNQVFNVYANGSYAVEISDMGCTDTSECILFDFNSIDENDKSNISIYPNPSHGEVNIQFSSTINQGTIQVRSVTGQLIRSEAIQGVNAHSLSLNEPLGIYFIEVSLEKGHKEVFKFIIK